MTTKLCIDIKNPYYTQLNDCANVTKVLNYNGRMNKISDRHTCPWNVFGSYHKFLEMKSKNINDYLKSDFKYLYTKKIYNIGDSNDLHKGFLKFVISPSTEYDEPFLYKDETDSVLGMVRNEKYKIIINFSAIKNIRIRNIDYANIENIKFDIGNSTIDTIFNDYDVFSTLRNLYHIEDANIIPFYTTSQTCMPLPIYHKAEITVKCKSNIDLSRRCLIFWFVSF